MQVTKLKERTDLGGGDMATMKASRNLRDAPNGAPIGVIANGGAKVDILANQDVPGAGSWTQVRLTASIGTPVGWVSADSVDASGQLPAGPIDKALFAKECWRQALYTGTNAHYLAAVAELRSRTRTGSDGAKTLPFEIAQADWKTTLQDTEFELDFLPGDIDNWRMQCSVFAVMTLRKLNALMVPPNDSKRPSAVDLCVAQSDPPPADDAARAALRQALQAALDATRPFVLAAGAEVLGDPQAPVTPTGDSAAQINVAGLSASQQGSAKLIVSKFQSAGYGPIQQIAAVANAIAESSLNPKEEVNNAQEHSVGLFQLNIKGGLGSGHTPAQLKDAATNIDIIINEAKKFDAFKNATSLFSAVDVFVRNVEKPANPGNETQKRAKIADRLKGTQTLLA
jgi:hypothetical protein